ncbi:hypothetical protein [Actinopolymorpha alba]|uniref:hypothetical protein n=1 Tax=Actinopolymorpha alba TaxID=533267 RepID=UPI0003622C1B|nr:hypothetical protein [Actinopolymorpha alba]
MDFATWARQLSDRGFRVLPPSHPVPVRLWALLPGGDLLQFRCQGTNVSLERYAEADLFFVVPAGRCDCGCGEHLPAPSARARLVIRTSARPIDAARYDGATVRGWRGHEAGLLSVAEAAPLFDDLLAELFAPVEAARR